MYGVDMNSATAASIAMWITTGSRRLRENAAASASPANTGIPTMNSVENVYRSIPATRCRSAPNTGTLTR